MPASANPSASRQAMCWPGSALRPPARQFQISSNPLLILNKGTTMSEHLSHLDRPTGAWISFSYISFGASLLLVAGGIFALPLDWWVRAYLAMGVTMVVQSSFTLAKNLRDVHEASRMINRIEEAQTERLLNERP